MADELVGEVCGDLGRPSSFHGLDKAVAVGFEVVEEPSNGGIREPEFLGDGPDGIDRPGEILK